VDLKKFQKNKLGK